MLRANDLLGGISLAAEGTGESLVPYRAFPGATISSFPGLDFLALLVLLD